MRKIINIFIALLMLLLSLTGCVKKPEEQPKDLAALAATEVKEYEGKDLSSILAFRENSIFGPQYIDIDTYTLKVQGLVDKPEDYTYDEVVAHKAYTKVVTLNCIEGWSVDILWEGILLKDMFDEVGVKEGATTVIFTCHDGYTTSLPLQQILDNNIMIAYKMNGITIPPERGFPFQLVAEDKYGYKWAKWITYIELSDKTDYAGYWEAYGYDNEADVKN